MFQDFKLIILSLSITLTLQGANDVSLYDRNASNVDLINGSSVTDTPYGFYMNSFTGGNVKVLDKMDLSGNSQKRLFVGYGTFDKNGENCRYLDVPSNDSFVSDFENKYVAHNKTYAISRTRMSYTQCKALTSQYSGFVFTPSGPSEYSAVLNRIYNKDYSGTSKDMWIGYSKNDCATGEYQNDEGNTQSYTNFRYSQEVCSAQTQYTYKNETSGLWFRTSEADQHYCAIKINSPDYLRPIKVCAPWWRIERTWKLNNNDKVFRFNNVDYDYKYMKYLIDYPTDVTICTDINTTDLPQRSRFTGTCQSYDSMKASPACVEDISLPQCHVDECKGYFEGTCIKTNSFPQFKNYDIGYILIAGIETKVKIRDNKTVNVYDCPPPPLPYGNCINQETVTVFPKECPTSECGELSSCLQLDTNTSEECLAQYKCEKSYGSTDNIIYENGTAIALGGVCEDGSEVNATIERKESTRNTCVEYNIEYETNTTTEKCIAASSAFNRVVSTSITTPDIYADDSRCIRTNNIEEARPDVDLVFSYKTKGFFKTAIQKAYIDGSIESNELNNSQYLLAYSTVERNEIYKAIGQEPDEDIVVTEEYCSNLFPNTWREKRYGSLQEASIKGFLYNSTGQSTRKLSINSGPDGAVHNITDSYGGNFESSGVAIAIIDSDYKITSYQSYESNTSASIIKAYLDSIGNGLMVAIHTSGSIGTEISTNVQLQSTLVGIGANQTVLSSLTNESTYLLFGIKGSTSISENFSNIIGDTLSFAQNYIVEVPQVIAISDTASCSANALSLGATETSIAFIDYSFSDLSLDKAQIDSGSYCFLGSSKLQGDSQVSYIKSNGVIGAVFAFDGVNSTDCNYTAQCLGGVDMNHSTCVVDVSQSTAPSEDIGSTTITDLRQIPEEEGSFLSTLNGYRDVFAIQEYTDGEFGYTSNYTFRLPKNNIILLDGKEVAPIVEQTPNKYKVSYDYAHYKAHQSTQNKNPDNLSPSFGFVEDAVTDAFALFEGENAFVAVGSVLLASVLAPYAYVVGLFSGTKYWGWYNASYKLYQPFTANTKYVQNVYGYDTRINKISYLLLDEQDFKTGTRERNEYQRVKRASIDYKHQKFLDMGFSIQTVFEYMTSAVETQSLNWEGFYWWEASAKETNTLARSAIGNELSKPVNTIYMGAVNMLSIIVPYRGEYEVIAYDVGGNLLARQTVQEQNFLSNLRTTSNNLAQTYAKIQFATSPDFNIAGGQDSSLSNGSCLASDFAEWGGGVSGVYYEQGVPDLGQGNNDCLKSNDGYVKEHSATKITLREVNSDQVFNIDLIKPMPFANRIVLVNLMHQEQRKYLCYDEIIPCDIYGETNTTQVTP